jgi:hypothetical protein
MLDTAEMLSRQRQPHSHLFFMHLQESTMDEIAKLLHSPLLASSISFDIARDGVVTFEDAGEAQSFRNMLEADGYHGVLVLEVDSHDLFLALAQTKGVVVLMGQGDVMPTPAQLAGALRGQRMFEDW